MTRVNIANVMRAGIVVMLLSFIGLVSLQAQLGASSLLEVKLVTTTEAVTAAKGIAQDYYDQVRNGSLTTSEAQKAATSAIKDIRYSGNEYIWINDMSPRMVAHPTKPELEGQDLSNKQDPRGKLMFIEMVDVVNANGSGIVDYMWPRPGSEDPVPKRSYVEEFEPWGWVIGSGVYIDDVTTIARTNSTWALGLALLIAIIAAAGVEIYARRIRTRIDAVRITLSTISRGDLTSAIEIGHQDELGLVMREVTEMQKSLISLVEKIKDPVDVIENAANEVARGGVVLSSSTEQAAASLEETSSAMTEFAALCSQLADTALDSERLASKASKSAQTGSDDMKTAAGTISTIAESSKKIADIIKIIDGVAFQTNLLALNASVEAARAGEHGRGFNVVAEEVRKLAHRASDAAAEIKQLIESSSLQVSEGVYQIESVGESISGLAISVDDVTTRVTEISHASREQAAGISEVSGAVQQLDSITQQNAALAEQSNAAAEGLLTQARKLTQLVSVFQVPGEQPSSPQQAVWTNHSLADTQKPQVASYALPAA